MKKNLILVIFCVVSVALLSEASALSNDNVLIGVFPNSINTIVINNVTTANTYVIAGNISGQWINASNGFCNGTVCNTNLWMGNPLGNDSYVTWARWNVTNISYVDWPHYNITNESYVAWARWNVTNVSYALNSTLATMAWNQTNTSYLINNGWNSQSNITAMTTIELNATKIIANYSSSKVFLNLTYIGPACWYYNGTTVIGENPCTI